MRHQSTQFFILVALGDQIERLIYQGERVLPQSVKLALQNVIDVIDKEKKNERHTPDQQNGFQTRS